MVTSNLSLVPTWPPRLMEAQTVPGWKLSHSPAGVEEGTQGPPSPQKVLTTMEGEEEPREDSDGHRWKAVGGRR